MIDDLIANHNGPSILKAVERGAEEEGETGSVTIRTPYSTSGVSGPDPPERPDGTDDGANHQPSAQKSSQTIAIQPADAAPRDAPAFLRRSFGSKVQGPSGQSSQLSKPFAFTATKMRPI